MELESSCRRVEKQKFSSTSEEKEKENEKEREISLWCTFLFTSLNTLFHNNIPVSMQPNWLSGTVCVMCHRLALPLPELLLFTTIFSLTAAVSSFISSRWNKKRRKRKRHCGKSELQVARWLPLHEERRQDLPPTTHTERNCCCGGDISWLRQWVKMWKTEKNENETRLKNYSKILKQCENIIAAITCA